MDSDMEAVTVDFDIAYCNNCLFYKNEISGMKIDTYLNLKISIYIKFDIRL